jgi:hypothetical protein
MIMSAITDNPKGKPQFKFKSTLGHRHARPKANPALQKLMYAK